MFGFQNMSYNSYNHKSSFLYCSYQFVGVIRLTMLFTEQENLTYIPLSSFIILLVILLTCASRRKKIDPYNSIEQNLENDIKGEYAIMCFPCLRKKPELRDFEPSADLSDQFEYIVEKYTIKKVPLLLANTTEDIIERQEELESAKLSQIQPHLLKDDFVNFQVAQEVYNVQRVPPCITVGVNSGCPGRKAIKERPKPSDVLESMSPVPRSSAKNKNYVVIPTKASLRSRDIMITKREITNQYLNNFSSVFVDNLKDQVPKDPERFPSLSRPYTSALRNYPIPDSMKNKSSDGKKSKRSKSQKVAYAFPSEDTNIQEEPKEEGYSDSDSGPEQTTDVPESEFQEDNETGDLTDKSKSLVLLNDSDSTKDGADCFGNPFKTTIKSSVSEMEQNQVSSVETNSFVSHKDDWPNSKNVTYEDIQALDVGYEFTSCEKLGVKPKMTRIHYPHESERLKDSLKQLAIGDSKVSKRCFSSQDQTLGNLATKSTRTILKPKQLTRGSDFGNTFIPPLEKSSSKSLLAETSFLPVKNKTNVDTTKTCPSLSGEDQISTTTFTSRSEESKSPSVNDFDDNPSRTVQDSVTEISKLYEIAVPTPKQTTESSSYGPEGKEFEEQITQFPGPSKSRSSHEAGRSPTRKGISGEVKGKDIPGSKPTNKFINEINEHEAETSCSLPSRESKTSLAMSSPRSSEQDEGKRATLRWKIVIKHHREDDPSRKNVNLNKKN